MEEKGKGGGLGVLAQEVPFAHHANSTIVCRITGKIMNEDNPPLAFDNGNVFSTEVGSSFGVGCSKFTPIGTARDG
jgi:macrophage erythroblast attacher